VAVEAQARANELLQKKMRKKKTEEMEAGATAAVMHLARTLKAKEKKKDGSPRLTSLSYAC